MSFPVIKKETQKMFEASTESSQHVPDICGYKGRACRQMDKEEGADRALCYGCALKDFADRKEKDMDNDMKNIERILEEEGISLNETTEQDNGIYSEIEFSSDAGEDCVFTVWHDGTEKGFAEAFAELAMDFDPDEHAEMWYRNKDRINGVPSSMRTLLDDADAIKETLENVATVLSVATA